MKFEGLKDDISRLSEIINLDIDDKIKTEISERIVCSINKMLKTITQRSGEKTVKKSDIQEYLEKYDVPIRNMIRILRKN